MSDKRPSRKSAAKASPVQLPATAPATAPATGATQVLKPLAEDASNNTLAINPLIGLRASDLGEAVQTLMGASMSEPGKASWHSSAYLLEMARVLLGSSDAQADPKDKRFADPLWRSGALHKRLVQAHATTAKSLRGYIDDTKLSARDKARAHLAASIYIDTIAPSNALINPLALRRAMQTRGQSLVKGFQNLVHDVRHNGGLPSSVDKSKFKIGINLCLTAGRVVFRNEVLELIQYKPTTREVYSRPLVVCPPQVNKFYALDLAPEKSLIKFALANGIQLMAVSWRNPGAEQRDWDMSTYAKALDEAVDTARQITGSPDVTLWGACSGGMTAAAYLGWLAATGQKKVANIVSPVCTLDPNGTKDTSMGLLMTPESIAALKKQVRRKGFVDGAAMARVFAWLRPNDLIWNYWVNNYLLGQDPPAFDVLYWNADTTRLPAAFHAQLLDIMQGNPFVEADKLKVLGEPIDMRNVDVEAYIVAGITDHITPWKACYPTARIYGERSVFTLANAGHLQSILNPPGIAKSFFMSGKASETDPDAWLAQAPRHEGSWWPHWMSWMHERSGDLRPAPRLLGSRKHKAGVAAPGEYVLES